MSLGINTAKISCVVHKYDPNFKRFRFHGFMHSDEFVYHTYYVKVKKVIRLEVVQEHIKQLKERVNLLGKGYKMVGVPFCGKFKLNFKENGKKIKYR